MKIISMLIISNIHHFMLYFFLTETQMKTNTNQLRLEIKPFQTG